MDTLKPFSVPVVVLSVVSFAYRLLPVVNAAGDDAPQVELHTALPIADALAEVP